MRKKGIQKLVALALAVTLVVSSVLVVSAQEPETSGSAVPTSSAAPKQDAAPSQGTSSTLPVVSSSEMATSQPRVSSTSLPISETTSGTKTSSSSEKPGRVDGLLNEAGAAALGEAPGAGIAAENQIKKSDLLSIAPNLVLEQTAVTTGSGNKQGGYVAGSRSIPAGVTLENIVFVVESDKVKLAISDTAPEFYEFTQITDYKVELKVAQLQGSGQSVGYAWFSYYFDNATTLPETLGDIWISGIRCDDGLGGTITLTGAELKAAAGDLVTEGQVKASAKNTWEFKDLTPSVAAASAVQINRSVSDEDIGNENSLVGNQVISLSPAGAHAFTLNANVVGASGTPLAAPVSGYMNTLGLTVQAKISASGGAALDFAGMGFTDSKTSVVVYDGVSDVMDTAFGAYFGLELDPAKAGCVKGYKVTASRIDASATSLLLSFEKVSNEVDFVQFKPVVYVNKVYVGSALGQTAVTAGITFSVGTTKAGAKSESVTSTLASGGRAAYELAGNFEKTLTLHISAVSDLTTAVQANLNNIKKTSLAWSYSLIAADANLGIGAAGNATRSFISNASVYYNSTASTKMNRIWFAWSMNGYVVPAGVGRLVLTDNGFNPDEMSPIGFMAPALDANGTASVSAKINGGAEQRILDSTGALTAQGNAYFKADATTPAIILLKNPDTDTITDLKITMDAVKVTSEEGGAAKYAGFTINTAPQVLFRANAGADSQVSAGSTKTDFTNTSTLQAYKNSILEVANPSQSQLAAALVASSAPQCTIPYLKDLQDKVTGNKSLVNLDGKGTGMGALAGDRIKYTVVVSAPKDSDANNLAFADGIWIKDTLGQHLDITTLSDVAVSVKRATASSTVQLENTNTGTTIPVAGTTAYAGVTPNKSSDSATERAKYQLSDTPEQMLFRFSGKFVEGDVITLTYTLHVRAGAQPTNLVENQVGIRTWTNAGGAGSSAGGGGAVDPTDPGFIYETNGDFKTSTTVREPMVQGDLKIATVERSKLATSGTDIGTVAKSGLAHQENYFSGDDMAVVLEAGLLASEKAVSNPVYMIDLNTGAALFDVDAAPSYAVYTNTLQNTNGTLSRVLAPVSNPAILATAPEVTYYTSDALLTTDVAAARYMRVQLTGTLAVNDMIQIVAPVKGTGTPAAASVVVSGYFMGGADVLTSAYLNAAGAGTAWAGTSCTKIVAFNNATKLLTGKANLAAMNGISYLSNTCKVYTGTMLSSIHLKKAASASTLYVGAKPTYTITLENASQTLVSGSGSSADPKHRFPLTYMVDILPVGQQYVAADGLTLANICKADGTVLAGSDVAVSTSTQPIALTVNGKSVTKNVQRLVLAFPEGAYVPYATAATVKYNALLDNLSLLECEGVYAYTATDTNKVSVFFNPAQTRLSTKDGLNGTATTSLQDEAADKAVWRSFTGSAELAGKSRLENKVQVTHKQKRVAPNIVKTFTNTNGTGTGKDIFKNNGGMTLNWKLVVSNLAAAEEAIDQYYVVDVLPRGFLFEKVLDATPEISGKYTNEDGSEVVYWFIDGQLAANANKTFTFQSRVNNDASGDKNNVSYMIPVASSNKNFFNAENISNTATCQFAPAELEAMGKMLKKASGTGTEVPVANAVYSQKAVKITTSMGAFSTQTLQNAGGESTSSATPSKTVQVARGETATFGFSLLNNGASTFQEVAFYHSLPAKQDDYIMMSSNNGRLSEWSPDMLGDYASLFTVSNKPAGGAATTLTAGTAYTLEYSASCAQDMAGWRAQSWVSAQTWNTTVSPAAFRIKLINGYTLPSGSEIVVTWKVKVPNTLPNAMVGKAAFGSTAYDIKLAGGQVFPAEPDKCGMVLQADTNLTLQLEKFLTDAEAPGASKRFTFLLEKETGGVFAPVKLNMANLVLNGNSVVFENQDDSANLGIFTLEATEGVSAKIAFKNLEEATYRITETNTQGYTPAYTPAAGTLLLDAHNGGASATGDANLVQIINTRAPTPRVLTIEKQVEDAKAVASDLFRFVLEKQNESLWEAVPLDALTLTGGITKSSNALEVGYFTMQAGYNAPASGSITGLADATYRVRELDENTAGFTFTVAYSVESVQFSPTNLTNRITVVNTKVNKEESSSETSSSSSSTPIPSNPEIVSSKSESSVPTSSGAVSSRPVSSFVGSSPIASSSQLPADSEPDSSSSIASSLPSSSVSTGTSTSSQVPVSSAPASSVSSGVSSVSATSISDTPNRPGSATSGVTSDMVEQFESQTGNPIADLINNNVPLGNLGLGAAWSLLNLICSVLGLAISVVLVINIFAKRKEQDKADKTQNNRPNTADAPQDENKLRTKRALALFKVGTILFGVLTGVLFLILEDIRLPMTWITQWTPIIVPVFVVHLVLLLLYNATKSKKSDEEDSGESEGPQGPAAQETL